MLLSTCINCDLSPTAHEEGDPTLSTELLIALSDCERSVSTSEALCSIFGINPMRTTYQDLPMCTKCGIILAELYRHFQMLMDLSSSSAYISTFIRQVEFWHKTHADMDVKIEASENEEGHLDNLPLKSHCDRTHLHPRRSQSYAHRSHLQDAYERTNRRENDSDSDNNVYALDEDPVQGYTTVSSLQECDQQHEDYTPIVRRSGRIFEAKVKKRIRVLEAKKRRMKLTAKYRNGIAAGNFKAKTKISNSKTLRLPGRPSHVKEKVTKSTDARRIRNSGKKPTSENQRKEIDEFGKVKIPSKGRERLVLSCETQGCKKVFFCYWMLEHHVQQDHLHISPRECPTCGLKCFRDDVLSSHFCVPFHEQKEIRKSRPFGCNLCGRRMANRGNFTHHCTSHDTEDAERVRCNQCKLTFKRIENLRRHEKIHSVEKPSWQCAICGKVFYVKRRLKEHHEIHEKEKKYLCSLCGMRFAQHKALVRHTAIHQDLSRHRCPLCGKGFKRKDHLHQHYRSKVHPKPLVESLLSTPPPTGSDITIISSEPNFQRGVSEEGDQHPASLILSTPSSDSPLQSKDHPTQVIFLHFQPSTHKECPDQQILTLLSL